MNAKTLLDILAAAASLLEHNRPMQAKVDSAIAELKTNQYLLDLILQMNESGISGDNLSSIGIQAIEGSPAVVTVLEHTRTIQVYVQSPSMDKLIPIFKE
jgi:hypothetical protein